MARLAYTRSILKMTGLSPSGQQLTATPGSSYRARAEYQIYKEILLQLGFRFGKGGGRGFSTRDLKDLVISQHKVKPLLVVLDEVDTLVKAKAKGGLDIIYTLLEEKISQILISNVYGWEDEADPRIKSRAKTERIDFPVYEKREMLDILRFTANKGLKKGVLSDELLEKITEGTMEKFSGDARKGKFLIAACVDQANREKTKIITEEHLAKAYEKVKPMTMKEKLANFARPDLVALAGFVAQKLNETNGIYGKRKPATTKNVHFFYKKCAKLNGLEPVDPTMMKEYLETLELGEIIDREILMDGIRGKTNVYFSKYDVEDLEWALKELGIKLPPKGSISEFLGKPSK